MAATSGRQDGGAMACMSSGLQINDSVKAGWDNVRNGDNGGWLLLELDAAKKALTAQRTGAGGAALLEVIDDDALYWGGFKGTDGRCYGLLCVGANVNAMKKGKALLHKNAIMNCLEGKIDIIDGNDADEFREKLSGKI